MAANRAHHFVPKCYLKNFGKFDNQKAISLFNIGRRSFVHSAPIKSQCTKNFLYGRDELEFHLGNIEGKYAEWITRGVLSPDRLIVKDLDVFCRLFCVIQFMRTEAHLARQRAYFSLTTQLANIPDDHGLSAKNLDLSDTTLARDGIMLALKVISIIDDLGFALIHNHSKKPFVTSDDPVVHTNRLYFQRANASNFGYGSAGAIFYLPLSPEIAMILYDKDVYSIPKANRNWVHVVNPSDADALNLITYEV